VAKAKTTAVSPAKSETITVKAVKEKSTGPKELITYGTGRRKNAVARVWVKRGNGKITVNGKSLEEYFARPVLRMIINQAISISTQRFAAVVYPARPVQCA